MIFSEESSRAVYEMGKMESIELRQTSATIQCSSCLKHVPEGLIMCQCGVWLWPHQSTMERIRIAFAALKTPYFRTTKISSRVQKRGHNPWETDHAKAVDAKRWARRSGDHPSIVSRMAERRNIPNFSGGDRMDWDVRQVSRLHLHDRHQLWCTLQPSNRYEKSFFMRGVDSNKQAGPLCHQGKGVPQIPLHLRTRQHNTLDPTVQHHLEWLSFNWKQHFSSSPSSTWTESSTWWSSLHWEDSQQWREW